MNSTHHTLLVEPAVHLVGPSTQGFRAVVFEHDQDTGDRTVRDIIECSTIDTLRKTVIRLSNEKVFDFVVHGKQVKPSKAFDHACKAHAEGLTKPEPDPIFHCAV